MNNSTTNPLHELRRLGQSIWLDDIGRAMLEDGDLSRLIEEDGIAGVTSNPSIFAHSMMHDPQYAQAVARLLPTISSSMVLYESLAIEDLQRAADLLNKHYENTAGGDGFVSLEVSPHLAYSTAASIREGKRLWQQLGRNNAMIKIPGTEPGLIAIRDLIAAGVNVNVTLLFSPRRYRAMLEAYFDGLETRVAAGKPIDRIASVASFFLSRIDTNVDKLLDALTARGEPAARALRGKAAVASAYHAYEIYNELIDSSRWRELASHGARPQRLLWASTSTKDPSYSPIKYVEELIVPGTVNTLPRETIDAYRRLGRPELHVESHLVEASEVRAGIERVGIDLEVIARELEREGIRKFIEPFDRLQVWLEQQRTR